MQIRSLAIATLAISLSGCAINMSDLGSYSSGALCRVYGGSLHPNFLDPRVKSELERRGDGACASYEAVQAREAASNQLLMMGTGLLQQSQPQVQQRQPQNCITRQVGGTWHTTCN